MEMSANTWDLKMKKLLTSTLAMLVAVSATTAHAGGPVIVEEEPEVVADAPASGAILPLLLVGIALCVALCGGDDDDEPAEDPVE
jgi:hypothetical protein